MKSLSSEHTLVAAIPILVVLAVLSAAIVAFPKANLDNRSRASEPQTPIVIPVTNEPFQFPQTIE